MEDLSGVVRTSMQVDAQNLEMLDRPGQTAPASADGTSADRRLAVEIVDGPLL
jgi:hypothetical protein